MSYNFGKRDVHSRKIKLDNFKTRTFKALLHIKSWNDKKEKIKE